MSSVPQYWLIGRTTPAPRPSARFLGWLLAAVLATGASGGAVVFTDLGPQGAGCAERCVER